MITDSRTFRSIADTVVPEASQLDAAEWQAVAAIIEHALSQRPRSMQRQLALFVRALNTFALVTHGRTLPQMSLQKRTAYLEKIQDSRVLLIRRGFWGLRTLILMGYYARPEAMQLIGYRAHIKGWQTRRAP